MLTNLVPVIVRAVRHWRKADGGLCAAAFAYYLLLSLLPLGMILISIGSVFVERGLAVKELGDLVGRFVPLTSEQERMAEAAIEMLLQARSSMNLTAIPVLLWGALKFARTMVRTSNHIWGYPKARGWLGAMKGLAVASVTSGVLLFGVLLSAITRATASLLSQGLTVLSTLLGPLSSLVPWAILFTGFLLTYKLASSRPTKFAEVWLVALVATASIWGAEFLFLAYVSHFAPFNALYGALGGIVALLLWIYLSSCVWVFGLCLCVARTESRTQKPDVT